MAFNFGQWLPYLIMGGSSVAGAVIGSRAAGSAAETSAAAADRNAENQLQMSREQIANLRDIYDLDLELNWPRHRLATESLGQLALGAGSKLPQSTFETPETPPELPGFGAGEPGAGQGDGTDPLDPSGGHFPVPPNRGPGAKGRTAGAAAAGAGLGAHIGSVIPGLGTAVGAGVGALAGGIGGLFGRGRREADQVVPYQNELVRRTGIVGTELSRRIKDGSITEQDWTDAARIVRDMRTQFYQFSDKFGRAGPGARSTIDSWFNPMLQDWDNQNASWADDWRGGRYFPNRANKAPSRRFGGPVGGTLSDMGKQRPEYLVGEAGPEMYVPQRGNPFMVGMGGPEMFAPPTDGNIVPNHDLSQQGAITLSDLGEGTYGMPRMLGDGQMRGRYMGSREDGGPVEGNTDPNSPPTETPGRGQVWAWIPEAGRWYKMWPSQARKYRYRIAEPSENTTPEDTASQDTASEEGVVQHLNEWGWEKQSDGTWLHRDGYRAYQVGDKLVAPDQDFVFDMSDYLANPGDESSFATYGISDDLLSQSPWSGEEHSGRSWVSTSTEAKLNERGWEKQEDGTWLNAEDGYRAYQVGDKLVSPDRNVVFDISDYMANPDDESSFFTHGISNELLAHNPWSRGEDPIEPGEFIAKYKGEFDFDPTGFQPLNEQFSYKPGEHGYMPLNEQFSFDEEDLLKDPGYQFRLNEGNKAIERKGASRGMLQSGRTLKSLTNWSQGLASQEYGAAYNRSRGEFGMRRNQSETAYERELREWGARYGQTGDAYNQQWQEYQDEKRDWWDNRNNRFNTTMTLAGI